MNDPSAVNGTYAEGINNAGQIVGYYLDASDAAHIFVYSDGAYFNYTDPSAGTGADEGTGAFAINNAGQIAGYYLDSGFNGVGFVADPPEASGTITADHGTTVDLANSTITGGTVNIAGVLDATGTSAIVDATIDNAGTIKSTGGGTLTIDAGALDNSGALKVTHGSTLDVSADVIGDGTVIIKNGGQADFTGAFDEDVTFSRAGTLALAQGYTGIVTGFGKGDAIDLTNLKYSPREYAIWNDGTLYIYKGDDATPEESIAMSGDYAANNFVVKNDTGTTEVAYRAADNWTYASSGPWHKAPDWSDGRPTPAKNAAIDGSGTYTVRITDTHPAFAQTLAIGDPDATLDGSGTLTTTRLYNTGTVRASGDRTFTINARGNGNANFGTIAALAAASLTIDNGGTTTNEIGGMVKAVGGSSALSVNNKLGGENYGHYKAADYGAVSITNHRTGVNEAGGVVEAANHGTIIVTNNSGGENYGRYKATDNGTITVNNSGTATNEAGGMVEATNNGTITLNNNFNDANYGTSKADDGTFILNVADTGSGEGGNYHTAKAVSGGTFTVNGSMANWSDATITATGRGSTFNFLSGDYTTDVLNEGTIVAEHRGSVSFNDVRVHNYDAIDVDPNSKVTFDHSHVTNDGVIGVYPELGTSDGTSIFDRSHVDNDGYIVAASSGKVTFDHSDVHNHLSIIAYDSGEVTFNNSSVVTSWEIGAYDGSVTFDHSHIDNRGVGGINANAGATITFDYSRVANAKSIEAQNGSAFTFDHSRVDNDGWISADGTSGSTATFDHREIDNESGGSIGAGSGGTVTFDHNSVDNSGTIGTFVYDDPAGGTVTFDHSHINNTGLIEATLGGTLDVQTGMIDNTNTGQGIVVDGSASTFLVDAAHLRLTGGGYVTLEDGGLITENADSSLLTGSGALPALDLDNVDNTIDGAGAIGTGEGYFKLFNQADATINANVSGEALTIDTGKTVINNGTLEATKGGILVVDDSIRASREGLERVKIGHDATVEFKHAVADQNVTFHGKSGTLALSDPGHLGDDITDLRLGDKIDLTGVDPHAIQSATIEGSQLVVAFNNEDRPSLTFNIAGHLDDSQFDIRSDHHGGTDLVLAEASPPPPPTDTWTNGNSDGQWSEGGNWSAGLPAPNEDVIIGSGSSPTINSSFVLDADAVQNTGTITVASGSTLTLDDGTSIIGDGTGTLTIGSFPPARSTSRLGPTATAPRSTASTSLTIARSISARRIPARSSRSMTARRSPVTAR